MSNVELNSKDNFYDYLGQVQVLDDILLTVGDTYTSIYEISGISLHYNEDYTVDALFDDLSRTLTLFDDETMFQFTRVSRKVAIINKYFEPDPIVDDYFDTLNEQGVMEHKNYLFVTIPYISKSIGNPIGSMSDNVANRKENFEKSKELFSMIEDKLSGNVKNIVINKLKEEEIYSLLNYILNKEFGTLKPIKNYALKYVMAKQAPVEFNDYVYNNGYYHASISLEQLPLNAVTTSSFFNTLENEFAEEFFYSVNFKKFGKIEIASLIRQRKFTAERNFGFSSHIIENDVNEIKNASDGNMPIFDVGMIITFFNKDEKALTKKIATFLDTFNSTYNALFVKENNLEMYSYLAHLPGHYMYFIRRNVLLQDFLSVVLPVVQRWQGHTKPNVFLMNMSNEAVPFSIYTGNGLPAGHSIILGQTGSGKSLLLNFLSFFTLKSDPYAIFYNSDYGDSFEKLIKFLGGNYFLLELNKPLSPLPTKEKYHRNPDMSKHYLQYIVSLLDAMIVEKNKHLNKIQIGILNKTVQYVYANLDNIDLKLIHGVLMKYPKELHGDIEDDKLARDMGRAMEMWVSPPYDIFFSQGAEFDLSNRIIGMNKKAIEQNHQLRELVTIVELNIIHELMLQKKLNKYIVFDEVARDLTQPSSAELLENLVARGRKEGLALFSITQGIERLQETSAGKIILANSPTRYFLKIESGADQIQKAFPSMSDIDVSYINNLKTKYYYYSEIFWATDYHKEKFRLYSSPAAYWAFTTHPADKRKLDDEIQACNGDVTKAILNMAKKEPHGEAIE